MPPVDVRPLKDKVRSTHRAEEPARILVESLPDEMDPYSFSISSEAVIRVLIARKD